MILIYYPFDGNFATSKLIKFTAQVALPPRCLSVGRKVRATRASVLPNGKAFPVKARRDRQCHRKQTTLTDLFGKGKGEKVR